MKSLSSRRPSVRALVGAMIALVVAGLLALGMSAPAFAVSQFTLTVKLTDTSGKALTNYLVYPITLDASTGEEAYNDNLPNATPVSGKPGYYEMDGLLLADSYTLLFAPTGSSATNGAIQYLGGTPTVNGATVITATSANVSYSASIATGGTISGKVLSPSGKAIKGADVEIYQYDGTKWVDENYELTNSSGAWSFTNAPPGSYKFHYYTPNAAYPQIWSGGASSLATADATFVSAGAKVSVSQKFADGTGSLSGSVQYSVGGDPNYYWNHWTPLAIPISGSTLDRTREIIGTPSNSSGAWSVSSLEPGNYVVEFLPYYDGQQDEYLVAPTATSSYVDEDAAAATPFTVTAGHKTVAATGTSIDGNAQPGAGLTIKVQNSSSVGIAGAYVDVFRDADGSQYVSTTSDSSGNTTLAYADGTLISTDGTYTFNSHGAATSVPLYPGNYTIQVVDPSGAHEAFNQSVQLNFGPNTELITLGNATHSGGFLTSPTISPSVAKVGTTYTASGAVAARASDPTTKVAYQWLRNGVPIYGANASTYTSTGADYLKHVSVRVTASSFGFGDTSVIAHVLGESNSIQAQGDAPVIDSPPTMVVPGGQIVDGVTLQATPGTWTIDGNPAPTLHYSYSWSVPGNTGSTFSPSDQNIQDKNNIAVTVTASAPGYAASAPFTTPGVQPTFLDGIANTKAPKVTSKTVAGVKVYSVSTGSWNLKGLTYTYAWVSGGSSYAADPSETPGTFIPSKHLLTLPAADPLTVIVYAHKLGYNYGQVSVLVSPGTDTPVLANPAEVTDVTSGQVSGGASAPFTMGDKLSVTSAPTFTFASAADVPTKVSYQWGRGDAPISKATSSSYTLTPADVAVGGAPITLSVKATFANGATYNPGPTQVGLGDPAPFPTPSPKATISGYPTAGQKLTASVASWGVSGVTDTYEWWVCATDVGCSNPQNPAQYLATSFTSSTFTPTNTIAGAYVVVTGTKAGYTQSTTNSAYPTSTFAPTQIRAASEIDIVSGPSFTGGNESGDFVQVGAKLTAVAPIWSQSGVSDTYTWQVLSSSWQTVGTGTTYTVKPGDYVPGNILQLLVSPRKSGVTVPDGESWAGRGYDIDPGTLKVVKAPKLTKTSSLYTVSSGTYSATAGASDQTFVSYTADGSTSLGTTPDDVSIPVSAVQPGSYVTVTVRQRVPGYADYSTTLVVQKGALKFDPETIDGQNVLGGTPLSVSNANPFSATNGSTQGVISTSYQWYANGTAISHATDSTYTPTSSVVGKTISVKVTGTDPDYTTAVASATESSKLVGGTFGGTYNPSIYPANPAPGVAAHVEFADGPSTRTFKYQWQVEPSGGSWTTVGTSSAFTPTASEVTDSLRAIVVQSAPGYTPQTLTTFTTTVSYAPTLAALVAPTLTQNPQVGKVITVNRGTWNTPGLTFSYAWYSDGNLVSGVTGSTWTVPAANVGAEIRVYVTASRAGYQPQNALSEPVTVGLGDPASVVTSNAPKITASGTTYTVSTGSWTLSGLTFSYQWTLGGVNIPGATTDQYTRAGSDAGLLGVTITASRTGYGTETLGVAGPTLVAAG